MARTKGTPIRRETSSEYISKHDRTPRNATASKGAANGNLAMAEVPPMSAVLEKNNGLLQVAIAVGGIYGSFVTWAQLQEKLTTTRYHDAEGRPEVWRFPVFLNTIQSAFAATTGLLYLYASTPRGKPVPAIVPSLAILGPLAIVALTSSLASPFGYAALAHIDYITYTLAKSCKLLPVMALHVTLFRKRYPLYKYLVVFAVTCGVAVFTLHTGKKKAHAHSGQTAYGLVLLAINLLFDGLTNTIQDYVFANFQPYTGPQMMCANNLLQTVVTGGYLLASPWLVHTAAGRFLGADPSTAGEASAAMEFMARHPAVWRDVLGFAACGAVGQVFVFYALATFSSVFLVTVTVTRKMFTMILSVFTFGHALSQMQVLGVALVFGGIGAEAQMTRREKMARDEAKRKAKAAGDKAQ